MFWIIEILFLVAGLWLLVAGRIPDGLFKALFGKGLYVTSPANARLFGLLLASPLAVTFCGSILIGMIFGEGGAGYAVFFPSAYLVIVAIAAIIIARRIKQPETAP